MNEPSPAVPNGRHLDGRFAAGNRAAVGHVSNARMKELRRALLDCATEEKVKAVEESLHELAVGGDVAAAKVWLDHVVGKPLQAVEVSGPDGQGLGVEVLMTAVLAALAPYPEARLAVAARLKEIPREHDAEPGAGAGDPA
jgi:hypothetical protein